VLRDRGDLMVFDGHVADSVDPIPGIDDVATL